MNLRPECPAPVDEQVLSTFAYSINSHDLHSSKAQRLAEYASRGGEPCDCEDDEDAVGDPEHKCPDLLDAEQCLEQARIYMALAQAAATAALAASTMQQARRP